MERKNHRILLLLEACPRVMVLLVAQVRTAQERSSRGIAMPHYSGRHGEQAYLSDSGQHRGYPGAPAVRPAQTAAPVAERLGGVVRQVLRTGGVAQSGARTYCGVRGVFAHLSTATQMALQE